VRQEEHVTDTKQPKTKVDPIVLIYYATHHHDGEKVGTLKCPESELRSAILGLLRNGVLPEFIEIWGDCNTVELSISLKPS
jgi:hypothetical protein